MRLSSKCSVICTAAIFFVLLGSIACHQDKKKNVKHLVVLPGQTAEEIFAIGEKKLKKRDYEQAIEHFDAVKNNFPYHELASQAHLQVAECYFAWKQFGQAADTYEQFRRLHPTHPKADYAFMRQAESHFQEAPKQVDRDLTACQETVSILEEFFLRYPLSPYISKAHEMSFTCRKRAAGREFMIGRFYYRQRKYKSSAKRLEGVLRDHAGFGYDDQSGWYLGRSYLKLKDYPNARRILEHLAERFPDSRYGIKAKKSLLSIPKKEEANEKIEEENEEVNESESSGSR